MANSIVKVIFDLNFSLTQQRHLILARDQKKISLSIISSYQSRLTELEGLQPSIDAGNEKLREREKLRTELRNCKHSIIDSTGKLEMLVLDEADDSLIQMYGCFFFFFPARSLSYVYKNEITA